MGLTPFIWSREGSLGDEVHSIGRYRRRRGRVDRYHKAERQAGNSVKDENIACVLNFSLLWLFGHVERTNVPYL